MTFDRSCKYFDWTKMESKRSERGLTGDGKASVQINYYPCLFKEKQDEWISECPANCPYFEPRPEK